MKQDLEKRWVIERGIEAGAQLILEIADHILSNHFGYYSETYEDSLKGLVEKNVISEELLSSWMIFERGSAGYISNILL